MGNNVSGLLINSTVRDTDRLLTSIQVVQGDFTKVQRSGHPNLEGALGDGISAKFHHNRQLPLWTHAT